MEEYPSMEVPGHRTLRSGRFFGTREDAVAGVKEGDSIYFQAGIFVALTTINSAQVSGAELARSLFTRTSTYLEAWNRDPM